MHACGFCFSLSVFQLSPAEECDTAGWRWLYCQDIGIVDCIVEKQMKPLSLSKNCNKDLHFPETTSTAIALQNFLQEICSQTLSPQTFLVDGSSNCNLRHSLQSQIVVPTASFPECYVCCCESDWCYLWEDLTSCFGLKQIIKALVFSRLWFSKDFIGENKKNSSVQHIQFGSSLCGSSSHTASNMNTQCSWLCSSIHCFLCLVQGVFSDLNSALTAGYNLPCLHHCPHL